MKKRKCCNECKHFIWSDKNDFTLPKAPYCDCCTHMHPKIFHMPTTARGDDSGFFPKDKKCPDYEYFDWDKYFTETPNI